MHEVPVFYATTEGQTRRIADRLVALLHDRGIDARAIDVRSDVVRQVDWSSVRLVVAGASVHAGRHQRAMEEFVRAHRDALNPTPSAFFSVSLRAASPKPADTESVRQLAVTFVNAAGWQPTRVITLAGRLAYTQYGWLTRAIMKRIARRAGMATDTTRDHEYTDWAQVSHFADDLAAMLRQGARETRVAS
jgi:menaquinone-dependent protoporphyrinogen oxidase